MRKKKILLLSIALIVVILIAIGTSYALFRYKILDGEKFKVIVGNLELDLDDDIATGQIEKENLVPTKDSTALSQTGYSFTLTNTGSINANYTMYLDDIVPSGVNKQRIDDNLMKVNIKNLTKNTSKTYRISDLSSRVLESGFLNSGSHNDYELRIWLDEDTSINEQNKYFAVRVRIKGIQRNEVVSASDVTISSSYTNCDNLQCALNELSKLNR